MSTLYITDNTGAQYSLQTNISGTVTEYLIPGKTGTWGWVAEKYGYQRQSGTFTPSNGAVSNAIVWVADLGITQATSATVAAYTTISTLDQFYDYSAYMRTQQPQYLLCSKTGTTLDFGSINIVIDAAASAVWSYNSTSHTLTVKSSTLSSGTTFTAIATTGNLTFTNSAVANCIYSNSSGTSTNFVLSGMDTGSSIWIADDTGATVRYLANQSGTVTTYIPPGASGTWSYAVECYGYQRQSNTFVPTGGVMNVIVKLIADTGLTLATLTEVQALAAITTYDQFYDAVAAYRLGAVGIHVDGNIATKSGTTLDIGTFNLTIDHTATDLISVASGMITAKAAGLATGVKYNLLVTLPPSLIQGATTEVVSGNIEDGNGDSALVISGGSGDFTLWKLANSVNADDYATGANLGDVTYGRFRFVHADGFKIIVRDNTTGYRQSVSMSKGYYDAALYFGGQVQVAQAYEITQVNNKVSAMQIELNSIKGTGYNEATDSLTQIASKSAPTLDDIENSTVLAKKSDITGVLGKIKSLAGLVISGFK